MKQFFTEINDLEEIVFDLISQDYSLFFDDDKNKLLNDKNEICFDYNAYKEFQDFFINEFEFFTLGIQFKASYNFNYKYSLEQVAK